MQQSHAACCGGTRTQAKNTLIYAASLLPPNGFFVWLQKKERYVVRSRGWVMLRRREKSHSKKWVTNRRKHERKKRTNYTEGNTRSILKEIPLSTLARSISGICSSFDPFPLLIAVCSTPAQSPPSSSTVYASLSAFFSDRAATRGRSEMFAQTLHVCCVCVCIVHIIRAKAAF